MKHRWSARPCGTQCGGDGETTMYWKETECLLCVALRHPLPATRSSALERLKKDLPPDRTVSTIDAWLDA